MPGYTPIGQNNTSQNSQTNPLTNKSLSVSDEMDRRIAREKNTTQTQPNQYYFDKQTGQRVTCPTGKKAVRSFAKQSGYECQ